VVLEELGLRGEQLLVDNPALLLGPDRDSDDAVCEPARVDSNWLAYRLVHRSHCRLPLSPGLPPTEKESLAQGTPTHSGTMHWRGNSLTHQCPEALATSPGCP
jgi:hypothetical protein